MDLALTFHMGLWHEDCSERLEISRGLAGRALHGLLARFRGRERGKRIRQRRSKTFRQLASAVERR